MQYEILRLHVSFQGTDIMYDIYEAFKGYLAFLEEMGEREF